MGGNDHGPNPVQEVISVFYVAGVSAGERVEVMFYELRDGVRFTPAVRDDWPTGGNLARDRPGRGILVDFGEEVKPSWSGVVWSVQVLSLSVCNEVKSAEIVKYMSELCLCL